MKICVIGVGYVGLVTGTCFAETGNTVYCIDTDGNKISNLLNGVLPIYEPGLKEMVERNSKEGRLAFSSDLEAGLKNALYCFITVGTPPGPTGAADLAQVYSVAQAVGRTINQYIIVVNKSTVPVGTAHRVKQIMADELKLRCREELEFDVVSNPEFLKEGTAVEDFMRPDRVVIGTDNVRTAELMKQLYEPFVRNQHPILTMDIKSAELTKYAANTMLAARISFMNEIARLCDQVGADVLSVRKGVGTDSRIGMDFLYAGIGYGGSCFPKDVKELIHTGQQNGVTMEIAAAVDRANEQQKSYLVDMVIRRFGDNLNRKRFGIWGLAFKPQTDDMREAPAIVVINTLLEMGAVVTAYDPEAVQQAQTIFTGYGDRIKYSDTMLDAIDGADALVLLTEWRQFRQPDFNEIKLRMHQPLIFDGRNQYQPEFMARLGFEYYCIGRSYYV